MNPHAAGEAVVIAVIVPDGFLRIAPAVVPFAVVEVDEPQALRFEPQRPHLVGPASDHVAQRLGQLRVDRIVLAEPLNLRRQRFGLAHRVGRQVLDLRQHLTRLLEGENGAAHGDDYNWGLLSLFSSLTNRIFVASALLAVFSLGVGIYNVNVAVTNRAESELRRGLDESRALIEENRRSQVEQFTREARLIADLPKLKAAVEPYHPPTILPIVEGYQQQLGADFFMVTDRGGRVLTRLPKDGVISDSASLPGVQRAIAGREASTFVPHAGGLLQLVSVPIWINPDAPDILGTLNIGFSLDRYAAVRFRSLMNSEIAFGTAGRIHSSTLPASAWPSLALLLDQDGLTQTLWLDGQEYIAMTVALPTPDAGPEAGPKPVSFASDPPPAKAIILRSRTERLSFLTALHTSFMVTALVVVLAATVLSYAIARTVTGPLATITAAMREMAATGDVTRRIRLPGTPWWEDEDARLLASTFNTMTESIERFQREAAQRERLSSLGRLSTVVAHEIRNPLMIIKAALHRLRNDEVPRAEMKAAVTDIDEEIGRLNHIVTEVLDFAKPIKFEMAAADVNALCADAVKASGAEAEAARVLLRLDPALPSVVTDAERLRLVLVNVLTNAEHAVSARSDASHEPVVITTRVSDGRVVVEVRDRGVGIAADDLPRIFDPYFTTRRTGTGLGLAISRNVIEGLGGTIAVASRHHEGTTVRIELPVR
jgi:signal transduction histidine kinase